MMLRKQRTIAEPVTISGKGLHTGLVVTLSITPAPQDHGYVFQRTDLEGQPLIRAIAENVVDTSRGTTIEEQGVRVCTIEHVMASLSGLQIDNALIKVTGPEVPILDGSARLYVEAILKAGFVEQDAMCKVYTVKDRIVYSEPERGVEIAIYPNDRLSIDVMVDYNSQVLGNQYALLHDVDDFAKEIAPCRTFVFLHEVETLFKHNLIKGGDLDNAIVIVDRKVEQSELDRLADVFNIPKVECKPEGVLNNLELRFPNEPARHKVLDLVGDLALTGMSLCGRVVATRPGHRANTELAKIVRQMIHKESLKAEVPQYDPNQLPVYDINQIKSMLPHRPPFLLIDKIIKKDERQVVGVKNVTMNEPFFVGHFPDEPVMPGVLQIEAMAQCGGILVLSTVPDPENYVTYFLKIDKVKFKRKVIPGDTLLFKLELIGEVRRGIVVMFGQGFVAGNLVCEGELMAQIVKNK
jgi:UDP-3-O-[3-hydroxymyristoyl] N-acetylglucosamine deacetylase/3-hydroxyacyl-[acyl-carrier-protein] dehydratase